MERKECISPFLNHRWSRKKMKRDRRISKMKERCKRMREIERRKVEKKQDITKNDFSAITFFRLFFYFFSISTN